MNPAASCGCLHALIGWISYMPPTRTSRINKELVRELSLLDEVKKHAFSGG
jgi:hypothetical protein